MPEDLYPIKDPNRIKDQFRDANWLTAVMVTVLRQYFGTDERISLDSGRFKWDPTIDQAGLQIDVVDNLKYAEGQKFPKALVDIENRTFPRDVISDGMEYKPESGTREFVNRTQSSFSIECWGAFKLEAHAIADEIYYFLQAFRHVIAKKYGFTTLRVSQILKPAKYKAFHDYWIARVIVEFETTEQWGVTQESLRLSAFNVILNADEPPLQP